MVLLIDFFGDEPSKFDFCDELKSLVDLLLGDETLMIDGDWVSMPFLLPPT